jgi:hypothetical protein
MTTPTALLDQLTAAGVEFQVQDGRLRFRSTAGLPVSDDVRAVIAAHRDELLAVLAPAGPGPHTRIAAGIGPGDVWWPDNVPEETVPVVVIPPRECVGPVACSRLGPCGRHVNGAPCRLAVEDAGMVGE